MSSPRTPKRKSAASKVSPEARRKQILVGLVVGALVGVLLGFLTEFWLWLPAGLAMGLATGAIMKPPSK